MGTKYEFTIMQGEIYNNALEAARSTSTVFTYYISTMKINIVKYSAANRNDFPSIHFQNKILKLLKAEPTIKQQQFAL